VFWQGFFNKVLKKAKYFENLQCDVHHEGRLRNFPVRAKKDIEQWKCIFIHSSTELNSEWPISRPGCFSPGSIEQEIRRAQETGCTLWRREKFLLPEIEQ
jgi:hypothetical protein